MKYESQVTEKHTISANNLEKNNAKLLCEHYKNDVMKLRTVKRILFTKTKIIKCLMSMYCDIEYHNYKDTLRIT